MVDFSKVQGGTIHLHFREKDDLPREIKGKAQWTNSLPGIGEPGYYIQKVVTTNDAHAIEFVNYQWYWCQYAKDNHSLVTNASLLIKKPHLLGLGTKGTPYLTEENLKRLQKREASSEPELEAKEGPAEDVDLPIGTAATDDDLATEVAKMTTTNVAYLRGGGVISIPTENPMQYPSSIQGAIEQIQGTSSSVNKGKQPERPRGSGGGGGGPGGGDGDDGDGGGGGGGVPPEAPPPVGQGNNQEAQRVGPIIGHVDIFNGDRTQSVKFEKEFGLLRLMNGHNPFITTAMTRTAYALSLIKGPHVDRWAQAYSDHLAKQVYNNQYRPSDEYLWEEFVIAFRRQYRDTAEEERA